MQVIEETPSRLVLQAKSFGDFVVVPILVALWLSLLGHGAVALLATQFSKIAVTTLSCQRVEPNKIDCEKRESLFGDWLQSPPVYLKKIKNAEFNSGTDSDGNSYTKSWVSVTTESGKVSAFKGFLVLNNSPKMNAIATKINQFIDSKEPLLIVQYDESWSLLGRSFVLVPAVLLLWLFYRTIAWLLKAIVNETLTFDKNANTLTYKQITLLGLKSRCHNLGNLAKVEVEEYLDSDDGKCYKLRLLLPSASTNYLLMDCSEKELPEVEQMAEKLRDLTGVPVSNIIKEKE